MKLYCSLEELEYFLDNKVTELQELDELIARQWIDSRNVYKARTRSATLAARDLAIDQRWQVRKDAERLRKAIRFLSNVNGDDKTNEADSERVSRSNGYPYIRG